MTLKVTNNQYGRLC